MEEQSAVSLSRWVCQAANPLNPFLLLGVEMANGCAEAAWVVEIGVGCTGRGALVAVAEEELRSYHRKYYHVDWLRRIFAKATSRLSLWAVGTHQTFFTFSMALSMVFRIRTPGK